MTAAIARTTKPQPRGEVVPTCTFIADVEEVASAAAGDVARAVLALHEGQALTPDLLDGLTAAFDDLEALRRRASRLKKTASVGAPVVA